MSQQFSFNPFTSNLDLFRIPGTGGVVFVSKSGNDASGRRNDMSRPFLTIQAALNACLDQDLVLIMPGLYTENLTNPGVFDDIRIRMEGLVKNTVTIQGTLTIGAFRYWNGGAANNAENIYFTFKNLTLVGPSGTTSPLSIAQGNAVKFEDCTIISNNAIICDQNAWNKPAVFDRVLFIRQTGTLLFNKTSSISAAIVFRNCHFMNSGAGTHSVFSGGNVGNLTNFINCTADSAFPGASAEVGIYQANNIGITSAYRLGYF